MRHAAKVSSGLYADIPSTDGSGFQHAGIQFSVVILQTKSSTQIANVAMMLPERLPNLGVGLFTKEGATLNNEFSQCNTLIFGRTITELTLVGMVLFGADKDVRAATKKFSLLS